MTSAIDAILPPNFTLPVGAAIFIQSTPPTQAVNGDLWFDNVVKDWKQLIANVWQVVVAGPATNALPLPTREGQFLVANAGLQWVAADADAGRF